MPITVDEFMTRGVQTVNAHEPLTAAHELMNAQGIRHLPVLDGGSLVGLVSQRDLHLIESLKDVDPKVVTIDEAMTQDVLMVRPGTPLIDVAREMKGRKAGSVVVMEGTKVSGIFTTHDAIIALEALLALPAKPAARRAPARKAAAKVSKKKPVAKKKARR